MAARTVEFIGLWSSVSTLERPRVRLHTAEVGGSSPPSPTRVDPCSDRGFVVPGPGPGRRVLVGGLIARISRIFSATDDETEPRCGLCCLHYFVPSAQLLHLRLGIRQALSFVGRDAMSPALVRLGATDPAPQHLAIHAEVLCDPAIRHLLERWSP